MLDDRKPFLTPEMLDKLKQSPVWDTFHNHDEVLKDFLWKAVLLTVRSNKIHMAKFFIGVGTESRPGDGMVDVSSEKFLMERMYTGQRAKMQRETPFTIEKLEYVMIPLCSTQYSEIVNQQNYFKTCVSDNVQVYWTVLGNIMQMYGGPDSLYTIFQWKTHRQLVAQRKETEDGLNKEKRDVPVRDIEEGNFYINYCHKDQQCYWDMNSGFIVNMNMSDLFSKSNIDEFRRVVKSYTRTGRFPILAVKDLHYGHPLNNDIEGNRYRPEYEGYQKKDAFVMKEELEGNILANQKMNLTYMLQSFLVRREWCLAAIRDMTSKKKIKEAEDKRKEELEKIKANGGRPLRKNLKRKSPEPPEMGEEEPRLVSGRPLLGDPMSPDESSQEEEEDNNTNTNNNNNQNNRTTTNRSHSTSPSSITVNSSSSGNETNPENTQRRSRRLRTTNSRGRKNIKVEVE